jgi:CheY-like chemotaxis protein
VASPDAGGLTVAVRVLVVDVYPDTAALLCELMSKLGHDCRSVESARGALDQLEAFSPHVVFLDLSLSRPNDYELTRQIRGKLTTAHRLVGVTGSNIASEEALAAGFTQVLRKPVSIRELTALLASVEEIFTRTGCLM